MARRNIQLFVLMAVLGCESLTGPVPIPGGHARVAGRIVDAVGQAVGDARIRIPLGDRQEYATTTDGKGQYSMDVPVAPFSRVSPLIMFATKDGYRPLSATYEKLEAGLSYNFGTGTGQSMRELEVGEFVPSGLETLVHFGDDSYGGEVNSQLQVATRGTDLAFKITTWGPARARTVSATISFQARGIQTSLCPSNYLALVSSTGYTGAVPANSDLGGNFTQYNLTVPIPSIENGTDIYLRVISGRCPSDYDDFEIGALLVRFNY